MTGAPPQDLMRQPRRRGQSPVPPAWWVPRRWPRGTLPETWERRRQRGTGSSCLMWQRQCLGWLKDPLGRYLLNKQLPQGRLPQGWHACQNRQPGKERAPWWSRKGQAGLKRRSRQGGLRVPGRLKRPPETLQRQYPAPCRQKSRPLRSEGRLRCPGDPSGLHRQRGQGGRAPAPHRPLGPLGYRRGPPRLPSSTWRCGAMGMTWRA